MGDVLMSTPAYVELLKHFPNAELLTLPCSEEIGRRFFRTVHISWDTVGRPDIAITFHVGRSTNIKMFLRRIPVRAGYWYRHGRLNIAKLCLNVRVEAPGQMFQDRYRVDEVCELLEKVFDWRIERKMRI
jgi:ADP-heptose:LPS heptosyltransferase